MKNRQPRPVNPKKSYVRCDLSTVSMSGVFARVLASNCEVYRPLTLHLISILLPAYCHRLTRGIADFWRCIADCPTSMVSRDATFWV